MVAIIIISMKLNYREVKKLVSLNTDILVTPQITTENWLSVKYKNIKQFLAQLSLDIGDEGHNDGTLARKQKIQSIQVDYSFI